MAHYELCNIFLELFAALFKNKFLVCVYLDNSQDPIRHAHY